MRYKNFCVKYMTGVCRDCLNQNTGLHLRSEECSHARRGSPCTQCGDFRFPIIGLKIPGRLHILFYRDKNK